MFGWFARSEFKELMSLYERAANYYKKDFSVVFEASNQALALLPNIKPWPDSENADRAIILANLLLLRASAQSATQGLYQPDINKQVISDLEEALKIYETRVQNINWARCCFDLSLAYAESSNGSRKENIERAIYLITTAKRYFKKKNEKIEYAYCCRSLADFYIWRLEGKKQDNLENALEHVHEASSVFTEKNYLFLWAELKYREAAILTQYDAPDRSERIEIAINQTHKLLGVFSRQTAPREWVQCRKALSELYIYREVGSKAENIEYAIEVIGSPLTDDSMNADHGSIGLQYTTLSSLYGFRIKGSKKENFSLALKFAQEAEKYCDQADIVELHYIKSLIARHALLLYKIDPSGNSKEVERKLIDSVEISNILGDNVSAAHNLQHLAEYYATASDLGSERFEKSLEIYTQIEDLTREFDPTFYHATLEKKAVTLARREKGNYSENTKEAMRCFQLAHDYFDENEFEWKLMLCKVSMARVLITMHANGIPDQNQRAIALLNQAQKSEIILDDPQQTAEIAVCLSRAYSMRPSGDRPVNEKMSRDAILASLQSLNPDEDVSRWVDAFVDFVQLVIDTNDKGSDNTLQGLDEFIEDNVLVKVDPLKFPVPWARIQRAYAKVLRRNLVGPVKHYETVIDACKKAVAALEGCKNENTIDWADAQFDLAQEYAWWRSQDSSVDYNLAVEAYYEGLSVVDLESWPISHFRIQLELGTLFVKEELWQRADESFRKAIHCAENYLDDGKNASIAEFLDRDSGWLLTLIPFVALVNGDIQRALIYSERFKARSLKTALDVEDYLSQQINEQSLRAKYKEIKAAERIIENQTDGNTQNIIDKLDLLKSDLERSNQGDLLSSAHREFNLDECLASLENWVLVPFVGYDHTILVLLPPGGSLEDAQISEVMPQGVNTLSTFLFGDNNNQHRWLAALKNFAHWSSKKREVDESTQISTTEKQKVEHEFLRASDLYELAQSEIDIFLWDNYGQWVANVINAKDPDNPVHLTIIPQSLLHACSFGSASDQQDNFLLDYCEISYSPSLSAKVSLDRRAKKYSTHPDLTFLSADPEELECSKLEEKLSVLCFKYSDTVDVNGQRELNNVINKLRHSNYWHFAMHGKFYWDNPGNSYLEMAGENGRGSKYELRLNILDALKTDTPLRLVSLSACEVGMQDFLKTPNEPLGFPASFIQIGAIGVIAPLWHVSDCQSALKTFQCQHRKVSTLFCRQISIYAFLPMLESVRIIACFQDVAMVSDTV